MSEVMLKGKEMVASVVEAMTNREKAMLLSGESLFSTLAIEKYGIESITFVDCASGINLMQRYMDAVGHVTAEETRAFYDADEKLDGVAAMLKDMKYMSVALELVDKGMDSDELSPMAQKAADYLRDKIPNGKKPTCFPAGIMLGASWNPEAVREIGAAVGKEAAAYGVDVLLGSPNVNIQRDPRNGRLFESFSEDPCLMKALAPELVKGVQDQNIGANVKHFAANNQETLRIGINAHVSKRALEEIYFPGFKSCVQQGNVMSLMGAYNDVNGEACSHNKWMMRDVLRDEWGFDGFTVCDWGGNYNRVRSLQAGMDLDMPGPRAVKDILDAIEAGALEQSVLDEACIYFLNAVVELTAKRKNRVKDFSVEESAKAAYNLAAQGITLLKNENVLPLDKKINISFFGERSKKFYVSGQGSALVITDRYTSMYDETEKIAGEQNISYGIVKDETDVVVITVSKVSSEGYDHDDLELPLREKKMASEAISMAKQKGKKIVLILNSGTPCNVSDMINDIDAMLWVYFPGQEGGRAAAHILFGDINPSGKLPLTFPKRYQDSPSFCNFPGEGNDVWYGEGIFVGYRWYDKREIEPLFPFGYGLTYTTFEIEDMKISTEELLLGQNAGVNVYVKVKNTGNRPGYEVVQIYVADEISTLPKPVKELKAFRKVYLDPGEEKELCFLLQEKDFASFHPGFDLWDTEPGWYVIEAGNSSRNITQCRRIYAKGHSVYDYGPRTLFVCIQSDRRAWDILAEGLRGYLNVEEMASALFFTPYLPFEQVWNTLFAPEVDANGGDADSLFLEICTKLAGLDVGQAQKIVTPLNS